MEKNPELTKSQMDKNLKCTKSRTEKIPNWTKSRIGQNPGMDKTPELNQLIQKIEKSGLIDLIVYLKAVNHPANSGGLHS